MIFRDKIYRTISYVVFFSIAMGFMETAVVVYMRALYYPEGFAFPLKIIANNIAITEFWREFATLIMLLGIGFISGRNNLERFAFFIFSFAIWDIFYYVFLKLMLGWPESLFTWDILFMIPLTWVGPVIAPIINSLTMILLALVIIFKKLRIADFKLHFIDWTLLILGSLVIIVSYTLDYTTFMLGKMSFAELFSFRNISNVIKYTSLYIPIHFDWFIFYTGVLIQIIAIGMIYRRA